MNPLKEKQVKQLEALNCADLARKVDELVKYINEQCFFGKEMTVNVCNGKEDMPQCFCRSYYDDEGKLQDCTCGKCGKPEPCQLHKETEWEDRERVGEKPFNKTEKAVKEERKRIGEEFKKWFDGEGDEDIEDTIERICGVKC